VGDPAGEFGVGLGEEHGLEQVGMENPDLRFQLLIKTRTPALEICNIGLDESHIREMLETFCSVLRAIESGIFFRQRGWACGDCQFAGRCNEG